MQEVPKDRERVLVLQPIDNPTDSRRQLTACSATKESFREENVNQSTLFMSGSAAIADYEVPEIKFERIYLGMGEFPAPTQRDKPKDVET